MCHSSAAGVRADSRTTHGSWPETESGSNKSTVPAAVALLGRLHLRCSRPKIVPSREKETRSFSFLHVLVHVFTRFFPLVFHWFSIGFFFFLFSHHKQTHTTTLWFSQSSCNKTEKSLGHSPCLCCDVVWWTLKSPSDNWKESKFARTNEPKNQRTNEEKSIKRRILVERRGNRRDRRHPPIWLPFVSNVTRWVCFAFLIYILSRSKMRLFLFVIFNGRCQMITLPWALCRAMTVEKWFKLQSKSLDQKENKMKDNNKKALVFFFQLQTNFFQFWLCRQFFPSLFCSPVHFSFFARHLCTTRIRNC